MQLTLVQVNTIRSYNVDPTLNHDECVSIFNEAGIYLLLDVNSPLSGQSLDRSNPSSTYTTSYLEHIFSVVEAFKAFPNVLGFFAGNEVINDVPTSQENPPYIRAVQRDLKEYIAQNADRTIPVGYSAADVSEVLQDTWEYLQCSISSNDTSRSDFFGLNDYSWCGQEATFQSSGYDVLVAMFANTTIPVFFSEYGCNMPAPRYFNEVQSLYGSEMTVMSGGLVYEWSQEGNDFGLVSIYSNASIALGGDFDRLQGQYNKLNVTLLESSNSTATSLTPPRCSSGLISDSGFSTSFDIPSPPSGASQLIASGISNAPTGKLVSISSTEVTVPVYNSAGNLLTGLSIKATNGSNTPSGDDTSSGASESVSSSSTSASATSTGTRTGTSTSSTASASASATGKGSAIAIQADTQGLLAAFFGVAVLML